MKTNAMPALLMVAMEPPASLEEEFNDWYDTEHLPQRRALPGFVSASRWVCFDGWPRWMALYDLTSTDALESDAYRAVSGANSTPWSRRILPRTVGRSRIVAVGLPVAVKARIPNDAQFDGRHTTRLLALSIPLNSAGPSADALVEALSVALGAREDLLQLRAFVEADAALWLFAAFDAPVTAAGLSAQIGRPCGASVTTFNLYVPYQRSTY